MNMNQGRVINEIFPEQNLPAYKLVFFGSVIYFFCIVIVLYFDNILEEKLILIDFIISYYLLILSVCKYYITVSGLIENDLFRTFFNVYLNIYICIYLIISFIIIVNLENINALVYLPILFLLIEQMYEGIYFYRFYYRNLPYYAQALYLRLGVSEKLNEAYKIRQKLLVFKDLLIFRIVYLIGTIAVFNEIKSFINYLQIIDIILNIIVLYLLQYHINCEHKKLRWVIIIASFLSFIKDILIIVANFQLTDAILEEKIDDILRNITYSFIYIFIIYYGYKDYKLFGSGLKEYIKRGRRGVLGGDRRMKIE